VLCHVAGLGAADADGLRLGMPGTARILVGRGSLAGRLLRRFQL